MIAVLKHNTNPDYFIADLSLAGWGGNENAFA